MTFHKFCLNAANVVGKISFGFSVLCAVAMAFIAIVSSVDSIGRYILGSALRGASEYVEIGMAVFVYGGLALAVRQRGCVTVPVFTDMMGPRLKRFFIGIGNLICCAAAVLVGSQMYLRAAATLSNLHYKTEVVGIPYGPFYLFTFLGMCLIAIELLIIGITDVYEGACWQRYIREHPEAASKKGENDSTVEEVQIS